MHLLICLFISSYLFCIKYLFIYVCLLMNKLFFVLHILTRQYLQSHNSKSKPLAQTMRHLEHFSNNAVCVDELEGHLHVPAGLIDEREVECDLPPQIHLIVRHTLQGGPVVIKRIKRGIDRKRTRLHYWRLPENVLCTKTGKKKSCGSKYIYRCPKKKWGRCFKIESMIWQAECSNSVTPSHI